MAERNPLTSDAIANLNINRVQGRPPALPFPQQQRQSAVINIGLTSPIQRRGAGGSEELSNSLGNPPTFGGLPGTNFSSGVSNRGPRQTSAMRNSSVSATPLMNSATTAMSGSGTSMLNASSPHDMGRYSGVGDDDGFALSSPKIVSAATKQRQTVVRSALFLFMVIALIALSTLRSDGGVSQSALKASGGSAASPKAEQHGEWWDEAPSSEDSEPIDRWSYKRSKDLKKGLEKNLAAQGNVTTSHADPNILSEERAAQLRRFILQQHVAATPWRKRHWRDYDTYRPIGFGTSDDDLGSEANEQKASGRRKLPWKKVFIATNLFNNEDMMADYLASLTTFIERGLLGRTRSHLDDKVDGEQTAVHDGDWFKPEDIFVSVYSNANSDSTPYLLEQMMHPILDQIGIRHHIVPQGAPSCSGIRSGNKDTAHGISTLFGIDNVGGPTTGTGMRRYDLTRKKPKAISRIEWLGCLRNHAMLPLLVHGREGLFGPTTNQVKAPLRDSFFSDFHSPSVLHSAFLEWQRGQRDARAAKADPEDSDKELPYLSPKAELIDYDAFMHEWFRDTYRVPEARRFNKQWASKDLPDDNGPPLAKCNHTFGLTGYFQQPYQNWWDPHSLNFKQNRQRYNNVVGGDKEGRLCAAGDPHRSNSNREMLGGQAGSSRNPNEGGHEETEDDDVLVLFLNDIYFYPWQLSYLIATNTEISAPGHEDKEAALSGGAAPSFDMACALDYYYNLYDTWVLRGLDGQPFTPYAPYAPLEAAVGPATDIRRLLQWQRHGVVERASPSQHKIMLTAPTLISDVLGYNGHYARLKDVRAGEDDLEGQQHHRGKVKTVLGDLATLVDPSAGGQKLIIPAVPVRSCWNGVVAMRGGLFLRQGLRFRYQTKEELMYQQCWESECKYIGQDMATIAMIRFMEGHSNDNSEAETQFEPAAEPFILAPARIVVNPLVQVSYTKEFFSLYQGEEALHVEEGLAGLGAHSSEGSKVGTSLFWWAKHFDIKDIAARTITENDPSSNESVTFEGDTADFDKMSFTYSILSYQPVSRGDWWFWTTPIRRLATHLIPSGFGYTFVHWLKLETWWPFVSVPPHPVAVASTSTSPLKPPSLKGEEVSTGPVHSKSMLEVLSLLLQVTRRLESLSRPSVEDLDKPRHEVDTLEPSVLPMVPTELQKFVIMGDRRVLGGRLRPPKDPEDDELKPLISDEDEALYKAMFGAASQTQFIGSWWWHHFSKMKAAKLSSPTDKRKLEGTINPSELKDRFEGIRKEYFFLAVRILLTLKDPSGYDLEVLLTDSLGVTNPPPRAHKVFLRSLIGTSPVSSILDPRFMVCVDSTDTFSLSGGTLVFDLACFGLIVCIVLLIRKHLLEHHHPSNEHQLVATARQALSQLQDAAMHPSHLLYPTAQTSGSVSRTVSNQPTIAMDAHCGSLLSHPQKRIASATYRAVRELFVAMPMALIIRPLALRLDVGGRGLGSAFCCGGRWLGALVRKGNTKDSAKLV